VAIR